VKPIGAVDGPAMNGGWSIAIAQDAADRDDDDVAEQMFAIARMAWVAEGLKVRTNRFDIDELCHGNILEIAEHRRAKTPRARRSLSIQRYGAPTYGARSLSYAIMRAGRARLATSLESLMRSAPDAAFRGFARGGKLCAIIDSLYFLKLDLFIITSPRISI